MQRTMSNAVAQDFYDLNDERFGKVIQKKEIVYVNSKGKMLLTHLVLFYNMYHEQVVQIIYYIEPI